MTRNVNRNRILAGLALAGTAAVTTLPAANGDIPIFQPTTITQPGRYVVTRDITAQGDVIVLQTGGVTLDLNGHTIRSVTGSGVVIDIVGLPTPPCNIVANGRIAGGDTGIKGVNLPAVMPVIIEKVGIIGPMFDCINMSPGKVEVRGSVLRECGRNGIRMSGGGGVLEVEDTLITDVQASGVFADDIGGATVRASTIRRFGLDGNQAGGVRMTSPGKLGLFVVDSVLGDGSALGAGLLLELAGLKGPVSIAGNQIAGNGASGIDLRQGAARITGNTITGNLGEGIRLDAVGIVTPSMISGNSILDNSLNGASILAGVARFNGNTVGGNLLDGVRIGGLRAFIENNFLQGNGGFGLSFLNGPTHAYRGNFVRGNNGGDIQDLFGNTDGGGNIK